MEDSFTAFCKRATFKQLVRDAVNDQMFWQSIFNHLQVETKVNAAITNADISGKVHKYLNNARIADQVRVQIEAAVPGLVSAQILKQLPDFLRSDAQMRDILHTHSAALNAKLEESARKHLEKIVNEDVYHEVHQAFFNAINVRVDKLIYDLNTKGNTAIAKVTSDGQAAIYAMKTTCDDRLAEFNKKDTQFNKCLNDVEQLKKDMRNQEVKSLWLIVGLGAIGISLGYIVAHIVSK
jgi:hypothetical protein